MVQFVNLTRNTIDVYDEDGVDVLFSIPTSTPEATATAEIVEVDRLTDEVTGFEVPVVRHEFYDPEDVPDPEDGVIYIVGYQVLQAMPEDREADVVAPDTGRESAVRSPSGRIIGVRRFRSL